MTTSERDLPTGSFCLFGRLCGFEEKVFRLASVSIGYNEDAPASMRGLALVDLPDFDSLFSNHVDTVRDIASRLDGIIWVTTPKKVGDLRAINEVHRVLKARTNFTYVGQQA